MLDFEMDKKVSNEIDEMLDFLDVSTNDNKENEVNELIEKITISENHEITIYYKFSELNQYEVALEVC